MRKRINIRDVNGVEKESLQLARKIAREKKARADSARVLKKTAHIGEYLKRKKAILAFRQKMLLNKNGGKK